MIDPISDMLTRIKNAQKAGLGFVVVPFSKMKMAIVNVFKREGFVADFLEEYDVDNKSFRNIKIILKYNDLSSIKSLPVIDCIRQISKQGQRCYVGKNEIKKIKNGFGVSVVSTSQGVMSGKEAKKRGLGGELICEIW